MALNLTQDVAELLFETPKYRLGDREWQYPHAGERVIIPLQSWRGREPFTLDLYRGQDNPDKETFQNRARGSVILARLDRGGPPHRNPDKVKVPAPHLHRYREGYGDRWAIPAPVDIFADLGNTEQTLQDFMEFVHIANPPHIL